MECLCHAGTPMPICFRSAFCSIAFALQIIQKYSDYFVASPSTPPSGSASPSPSRPSSRRRPSPPRPPSPPRSPPVPRDSAGWWMCLYSVCHGFDIYIYKIDNHRYIITHRYYLYTYKSYKYFHLYFRFDFDGLVLDVWPMCVGHIRWRTSSGEPRSTGKSSPQSESIEGGSVQTPPWNRTFEHGDVGRFLPDEQNEQKQWWTRCFQVFGPTARFLGPAEVCENPIHSHPIRARGIRSCRVAQPRPVLWYIHGPRRSWAGRRLDSKLQAAATAGSRMQSLGLKNWLGIAVAGPIKRSRQSNGSPNSADLFLIFFDHIVSSFKNPDVVKCWPRFMQVFMLFGFLLSH